MRHKYGSVLDLSWSSAEQKKGSKLRAAADAAARAFLNHVYAISPRNWRSGAPLHWLCEELTYEDAIRPLTEPLSVIPPLAYGATDPIR